MGAQVATPLAVALNELVQNAVEHAFASPPGPCRCRDCRPRGGPKTDGQRTVRFAHAATNPSASSRARRQAYGRDQPEVHVSFDRHGDELFVQVRDNGIGLPAGLFDRRHHQPRSFDRPRAWSTASWGGRSEMYNDGGTVVELVVPVGPAESNDLAAILSPGRCSPAA